LIELSGIREKVADNSSDGHLVSFDIPRVALQKTKSVIDQGLGGLMWWSVDEDWVEPSPSTSTPAKRDESKKRTCKKATIGDIHAVEPINSTSSGSVSISDAITSTSASTQSQTFPSTASIPSPVSGSEAEGEKDGIQLNIGRSLVHVAKEGFEKYATGLDTTWNVLGYPSSSMSLFLFLY
jgi:hypothetical protein